MPGQSRTSCQQIPPAHEAAPASDAVDPVLAQDIAAAITAWFAREGRDYPWRQTQDPYAILVSEVMLQQTQIATVLGRGYYARWMAQFPDVQTLAAAGEAEILKAWEGLGYYSRARNLQKAAQAVVRDHGGVFPRSHAAVLALPGVGRYTAGAVVSFAWNEPAPLVDGNVARVLARLFAFAEPVDSTAGQRWLWAVAECLVPRADARRFNSGLMELGQRLCTPRAPQCGLCPLARCCAARGADPESLPVKRAAPAVELRTEHAVLTARNGRLLMRQETGRRRQGLWMLPERPESHLTETLRPLLSRTQYAITRYRVTLCIYDAPDESPAPGEEWVPLTDLPHIAMPGPWRRAVEAALKVRSA